MDTKTANKVSELTNEIKSLDDDIKKINDLEKEQKKSIYNIFINLEVDGYRRTLFSFQGNKKIIGILHATLKEEKRVAELALKNL